MKLQWSGLVIPLVSAAANLWPGAEQLSETSSAFESMALLQQYRGHPLEQEAVEPLKTGQPSDSATARNAEKRKMPLAARTIVLPDGIVLPLGLLSIEALEVQAMSHKEYVAHRRKIWLEGCGEVCEEALEVQAMGDEEYFAHQRNIMLEGCGEVCDTSAKPADGVVLHKNIQCEPLYANLHNDAPAARWPPPRNVPNAFEADFFMGGDATLRPYGYLLNRYSGTSGGLGSQPEWTEEVINAWVESAKDGHLPGTYGEAESDSLMQFMHKQKQFFEGKRLVVVGSEYPWVEAILLAVGAAHVTTLEYGTLPRNPHPQVSTMTPGELTQQVLAGTAPTFQGGATYSSLEHSGLGRYGDTVNPWGDLQAMAKIWCVMEEGATFVVGVPAGADLLEWNAHRRYGLRRWPHFTTNWELVDSLVSGLGGASELRMLRK